MTEITETDISHECKMVFWAIKDFPFVDCGVATHTIDDPMKGRAYRVHHIHESGEASFVINRGILLVVDDNAYAYALCAKLLGADMSFRRAQHSLFLGTVESLRRELRDDGHCKELADRLEQQFEYHRTRDSTWWLESNE